MLLRVDVRQRHIIRPEEDGDQGGVQPLGEHPWQQVERPAGVAGQVKVKDMLLDPGPPLAKKNDGGSVGIRRGFACKDGTQ